MFNFSNALKKGLYIIPFLLLSITLKGAYLEKIPTTVTNPDGTKIECYASGDEYFNYLHDADGFTIIKGKDGYYYYGIEEGDIVVPSPFKVNSIAPKAAGLKPHAKISEKEYKRRVEARWSTIKDDASKAPHTGDMNNLVIYIRFNDDAEFTTQRSVFDGRLNSTSSASLKHYFQEVSYGQLDITSYHYPIADLSTNLSYQDSYDRSYFQPYDSLSNANGYNGEDERREREHALLQRAIESVENEIPEELTVDGDSDGLVDNVCFIIRGNAEGWSDLLWAHRWALFTYEVYINNKRVYDYTFQPENQSTTSTLSHEMFHTLGAPDLYRYYNETGFAPVGPWDLMSSGFVHMGAFMKYKYANGNWINEIPTISEPGTYTLNPLTSSENNAFRINSPNSSTEFFVVEYRLKSGFYENNLPQSGMLIYRINLGAYDGNAYGPPDEVYIYRPSGSPNSYGNVNLAAYSSSYSRDAISDNTNPRAFLSDGSDSGIEISNISEIDETISFSLYATPVSFYGVTKGFNQIDLFWQNTLTQNSIIAYNTVNSFGKPQNGTDYEIGEEIVGGGTIIYKGLDEAFEHIGLSENTTYYYKIWSLDENNRFSVGASTSAKTYCSITAAPLFEDFNGSSSFDCWITSSNEANSFIWNKGSHSFGIDNADGEYAYISSYEYGNGNNINTSLISPSIDLTEIDNVNISFTHYYRHRTGSEASLNYSLDNGNTWELINIWDQTTENPEQFSVDIPELSNAPNAMFKWTYISNDIGYFWSIDDIYVGQSTNTSISNTKHNSIMFYPNPFTNQLTIDGIKNVERIVISNIVGQKVHEVNNSNDSHKINTSQLKKGIHLVTLHYNDGSRITRKLIKQ